MIYKTLGDYIPLAPKCYIAIHFYAGLSIIA